MVARTMRYSFAIDAILVVSQGTAVKEHNPIWLKLNPVVSGMIYGLEREHTFYEGF